LITLINGDFDPEAYFRSSFNPPEIHAENGGNLFVNGTEGDAEDETVENNDAADGAAEDHDNDAADASEAVEDNDGTARTTIYFLHLWTCSTILSKMLCNRSEDSRGNTDMLLPSYDQKKGKDGEVNKVYLQYDHRASHVQKQNRWRIKGTRRLDCPFSGILVRSKDIGA